MPLLDLSSFFEVQKQRIEHYEFIVRLSEQGQVVSVGDGIIWIKGLASAAIDEILISEDSHCMAMVFHLTEFLVSAILLIQSNELKAGTLMYHFKRSLLVSRREEWGFALRSWLGLTSQNALS